MPVTWPTSPRSAPATTGARGASRAWTAWRSAAGWERCSSAASPSAPPRALTAHLSAKDDPTLLFAGQLTGVEGYTESAATGILAGVNLARLLAGDAPVVPPPTTMLGALYRYVHTADPEHFQPMNANFGLLEPLERAVKDKQKKREQLVERALRDMEAFAHGVGVEVSA